MCLLLALAVAGCRPDTTQSINSAQAIQDLADAITSLRQDNSELLTAVDSLRGALAKQDTVVRRLANLAGMPMP